MNCFKIERCFSIHNIYMSHLDQREIIFYLHFSNCRGRVWKICSKRTNIQWNWQHFWKFIRLYRKMENTILFHNFWIRISAGFILPDLRRKMKSRMPQKTASLTLWTVLNESNSQIEKYIEWFFSDTLYLTDVNDFSLCYSCCVGQRRWIPPATVSAGDRI